MKKNITTVLAAVILTWSVMGCGSAPSSKPDFIIRAGDALVSSQTFARELDLKRYAYPYDLRTRRDDYNAMVLDLVSTLSDEIVILAAAQRKNIEVSEKELNEAEKGIRQDYPEDSFDRMLLANAIEYTVWKNRLKKDMVIAKVIAQELMAAQEISPEEIVSFYKRLKDIDKMGEQGTGDVDGAELIKRLRVEKSQSAYVKWVQGLKEVTPPEINQKALGAFLIH